MVIHVRASLLALTALFATLQPFPVRAQDSTGVKLAPVPEQLSEKDRKRLEKQRVLVQTAVNAINAAIEKFNQRCGTITDPGMFASCKREMSELEAGGAELEQLKIAFNADVEGAVARTPPLPLPKPAAAREQVSVASSETKAPARKTGSKGGGGTVLQQLKSAAKSGDKAKVMEDGRDPAMDVFDRAGGPVEEDKPTVLAGMRKELVIPDKVRKDPEFQKLAAKQKQLETEHTALEKSLAALRAKRGKGGDVGLIMVDEAKVKQKLSNNEAATHDNRRKQEEMVDRSVKFGTKTDKPARKTP